VERVREAGVRRRRRVREDLILEGSSFTDRKTALRVAHLEEARSYGIIAWWREVVTGAGCCHVLQRSGSYVTCLTCIISKVGAAAARGAGRSVGVFLAHFR
jgi:hypothetical protein